MERAASTLFERSTCQTNHSHETYQSYEDAVEKLERQSVRRKLDFNNGNSGDAASGAQHSTPTRRSKQSPPSRTTFESIHYTGQRKLESIHYTRQTKLSGERYERHEDAIEKLERDGAPPASTIASNPVDTTALLAENDKLRLELEDCRAESRRIVVLLVDIHSLQQASLGLQTSIQSIQQTSSFRISEEMIRLPKTSEEMDFDLDRMLRSAIYSRRARFFRPRSNLYQQIGT